MSRITSEQPIPRAAILGAGALVLFTLVGATVAKTSGIGAERVPDAALVSSQEFQFLDRADGAVVVIAGQDTNPLTVLDPGTNGFVRGVMRGLARGRKLQEVGADRPFRLTHWSDGRLSLTDPETGHQVELNAFGPTNVGVFADILALNNSKE